MRILLTVEFYRPRSGGAEEVVRCIAEYLAGKGNDVTVATTYLPKREFKELNGVKIEGFKLSGNSVNGVSGGQKEIERYRRFILTGGFDIVFNYAGHVWITDLVFEILDKITGKTVFAPIGYSKLNDPKYEEYFKKLPEYLKKYDKLIYPSPNYQDKLFGDENGVGDKAVIIPNGASEAEFSRTDNIDIKKRLGINTPRLVITVSNHYLSKGHRFVISAFKRMNRKDATLLIVGEPFVSTGIRKFVHFVLDYLYCFLSSVLNKNIKLVNGRDREVVLSAYAHADLFLFGSHVECAPLVMYESFASGTPFVTRNVGNVGDHRDYLKIIETENEMAERSNELLDNPDKHSSLSDRALALWKKSYTTEEIVNKYEKLFKRLCNDGTEDR